MPTATVKVAYVNPPKEGKKQGSIKTTDDSYYGVDPSQLNLFEKGGSYQIEYTSREYQGKTYKTVSKVLNGSAVKSGGDAKTVEMFAMGFMNRCYQGTGQVPEVATGAQQIRCLRKMWEEGFKDGPTEIEPDPEEFDDPLPF